MIAWACSRQPSRMSDVDDWSSSADGSRPAAAAIGSSLPRRCTTRSRTDRCGPVGKQPLRLRQPAQQPVQLDDLYPVRLDEPANLGARGCAVGDGDRADVGPAGRSRGEGRGQYPRAQLGSRCPGGAHADPLGHPAQLGDLRRTGRAAARVFGDRLRLVGRASLDHVRADEIVGVAVVGHVDLQFTCEPGRLLPGHHPHIVVQRCDLLSCRYQWSGPRQEGGVQCPPWG